MGMYLRIADYYLRYLQGWMTSPISIVWPRLGYSSLTYIGLAVENPTPRRALLLLLLLLLFLPL